MKIKKLNFGKKKNKLEPKKLKIKDLPPKPFEEGVRVVQHIPVKKRKRFRGWSRKRKILTVTSLLLVILLTTAGVLSYFYIVVPALKIKNSVEIIKQTAVDLGSDFEKKDLTNIDARFEKIQGEFDAINKELDRYEFLKTFSYTKGYYNNLQVIQSVVDKTDKLTEKTLPDLKVTLEATGFKVSDEEGESGKPDKEKDENGAFSLVLANMQDYLDLYAGIEPDIQDIITEIQKLDPEYLPSVGGINVDETMAKVDKLAKEFPETSDQITDFLSVMPELLGAKESKTYMLILQNETEMRSSGGLLTAYGTMTLKDGEFVGDIKLTDMWNLENYVRGLGINTGPKDFNYYQLYPEYVSPYGYYQNIYGQNTLMNRGCGATSLRAQDSGLYPDLNWTMNIFKDYYDNANYYDPINYPAYEDIVIINYAFAENLFSLIQPVEVKGEEITAEELFNFIKESTDDRTVGLNYEQRKQIIADIANVVKEKFLELPIEDTPKLANLVINSFAAKDIAIAAPKNNERQQYLDTYGMSGRTTNDYEWDYFHFNEAQNCALKLNKFLRNRVTHEVIINDDGSIKKNITVNWTQPQIWSAAINDQYSGGISHSYRAWIRFFMPMGSSVISSNGYEKSGYLYYTPLEYDDSTENKHVSDNIIQFDHRRFSEDQPVVTHDLNVMYNLPGTLNYNQKGQYKVLIQKHPGKSWEKYTFKFKHKGKTYELKNITLDRDKVITYKDGIITVEDYNQELDWIIDIVNEIPFDKIAEKQDDSKEDKK